MYLDTLAWKWWNDIDKNIMRSNKKKYIFFWIILYLIITLIIINDLSLLKLIKPKNLISYSVKNIKEDLNIRDNTQLNYSLVYNEVVDYTRILIFEVGNKYHIYIYNKGRITDLYNFKVKYVESKDRLESEKLYKIRDSVYTNIFKLYFDKESSRLRVEHISKERKFDFSYIEVLFLNIIFILILLKVKNSLKHKK